MTKITTVYDQILTTLATIFPDKMRIFDAYSLLDNPSFNLRDSYGLVVQATQASDLSEICSLRDDHTFQLVLTREIIRQDSQITPVDIDVKLLLEDAFTARERLYRYDKIGLMSEIENVTLGQVSPVQRIRVDKGNFFTITVEFTVQIAEDLHVS